MQKQNSLPNTGEAVLVQTITKGAESKRLCTLTKSAAAL